MPSPSRDTPALPCPECRERGSSGNARIGNRRALCSTCNRWAQAVYRETLNRLRAAHQDEIKRLRLEVELQLYPSIIEEYEKELADRGY